MRKILALFFILSFTISYAQNFYLDKHYNINNRVSTGFNIIPETYGYSLCGVINDSLINKLNIIFLKLDTLGNILSRKEIQKDSAVYYTGSTSGGGFVKCKNGGYLVSGNLVTTDRIKIFLMRLDENFDTLWTKILYDDTIFMPLRHCIETSDNGFAFCGEKNVYGQVNNKSNAFIVKTDSLGNLQFEKLYNITGGHNGDNQDAAYNIIETPEKNFLLGCYTVNINIQGTSDPVVIKTDSLGNVKWIKNFGSYEMEPTAVVNVSNDSNYIVACVLSSYTGQYNDPWIGKLHVIKLRPDGSVIWEKFYEPSFTYLTAYNIVSLPNGDFLISGIKEQVYGNDAYMMSYLLKINSNGDSLWYRDIYHTGVLPNIPYINYLYTINTTSDGGIIGCGRAWDPAYITQGMWFIKTDSLGCLQPGCQYVGVEELQKARIGEIKISPNPANDFFIIEYSFSKVATDASLIIYDALGKKIEVIKLTAQSEQKLIDCSQYAKGLYHCVLSNNGNIISTAKISVIK